MHFYSGDPRQLFRAVRGRAQFPCKSRRTLEREERTLQKSQRILARLLSYFFARERDLPRFLDAFVAIAFLGRPLRRFGPRTLFCLAARAGGLPRRFSRAPVFLPRRRVAPFLRRRRRRPAIAGCWLSSITAVLRATSANRSRNAPIVTGSCDVFMVTIMTPHSKRRNLSRTFGSSAPMRESAQIPRDGSAAAQIQEFGRFTIEFARFTISDWFTTRHALREHLHVIAIWIRYAVRIGNDESAPNAAPE